MGGKQVVEVIEDVEVEDPKPLLQKRRRGGKGSRRLAGPPVEGRGGETVPLL